MKSLRIKSYLSWIRSQACICCGRHNHIEAAHVGMHGLGQKSPDSMTIPLCPLHHRTGNDSYHRLGPVRFAEKWNLDIGKLVEQLNEEGLRGLKCHAPARKQVSPGFVRLKCICGFQTAWYRILQDAQGSLLSHIEEREEKAA